MQRKKVVILGSTGSIGINTLKVIERYPDRYQVVGLTAYSNVTLLSQQIKKFSPSYVAVNESGAKHLRGNFSDANFSILNVSEDLEQLVSLSEVDVVVIAMRGSAALRPFLSAVRAGKRVAPANKEALVVAGDLIMREAEKYGAEIIPVDSEQSAIFQCLEGKNRDDLDKVILTASGGALLNVEKNDFSQLSVEQILDHPRWKMGKKITVDSATLMNKGFEVIEAKVLFQLQMEQVQVVIHPEALIHSMVQFKDGSILAQLSLTDMRLPIQYALTYPDRLDSGLKPLDFCSISQLTFQKPDLERFPSLDLAIEVGKHGGTLPSVLNAADEEAVDAFLDRKLKFVDIYQTVESVVRKHKSIKTPELADIIAADRWAREETRRKIS